MTSCDLVVRGGTVVTAAEVLRCDVGIRGGRIVALGSELDGAETFDAGGLLVMPGGVDSHCHIEQLRPDGRVDEESFVTASASALAGGTTSVICFASQFKGHGIRDTLAEYHRRARQAMVDYSFHQIITDPTDQVVWEEIPEAVAAGVRSLKVFLTYDPVHLDDREYLRVLAAARRNGALVTVHCENYEAIRWRTEALLADGRTEPKYHAWSRPKVVEREATHRAIALAELVDQPIQIFHVSCPEAAEEIARAQQRGVKVWAETCPQYFVLRADDMDRPGFEGAKFICSPSPREAADSAALWDYVRRGVLDVISSDHSGASYEGNLGKRMNGPNPPFRDVPNGARLPLADRVQRGGGEGPHGLAHVRAAHRVQPGAAVRAGARQGQHRSGRGCRPGVLGPGEEGDDHQPDFAARHRLHAVRRVAGDRLAGRDDEGRARGDAGRGGAGRAGKREILAARPVRADPAGRRAAERF